MRKNYKEKRIYVDDRTFLIEFWEDCGYNITLNYVRVSEITLEKTGLLRSFFGIDEYEVKRELGKCWGAKSRVEWAMDTIESHLRYEKHRTKEIQEVNNFCN